MASKSVIKLRRKPRRAAPDGKEQVRSAEHLREIARGATLSGGKDFFPSLARFLCETLKLDYAFVGELDRQKSDRINVINAYFDEKLVDPFTYYLKDTPCANVVNKNICVYPRGVRRLFPKDQDLETLKAESYAGVPLFGSGGEPLGLLAVMDREPLDDPESVELLLEILAPRAAAEIERRHIYDELADSNRTLSTLITNLPGLVYRCRNDRDWTLEFISEGCQALTGYTPDDFIRDRRVTYGGLIHPQDQEYVWNDVQAALKESRPFQLVYRIIAADGSQKWVWEQGQGVFTPDGQLLALEGFITDITERKLAERSLWESEVKFRTLFELAKDAIFLYKDGVFVDCNQGTLEMFQCQRHEIIGRSPIEFSPPHQPDGRPSKEKALQKIKAALGGEPQFFEWEHTRLDGTSFHAEVSLNSIELKGERYLHAIVRDVTERMQAQERLQYLAHHDSLTSLPNRAMFLERLDHALTRARWTQRSLAVLFLDLDRFKNINDTLGHDVGDRTLRIAAQRLTNAVREGDTVARLGGDEFTVLLEDIASSDDVPLIAQKILESLSRAFEVEGREFVTTTSIGISLYPTDGDDSLKLLRNADTAMYRAKEQGRNKFQFYSAEMGAKALEKFMLESSLRHALERNEFRLYYQPQVNLATGTIAGVEALLRWQHPELGLVLPGQFIPVAEETGLMKSIDEWVLHTACQQAQAWRAAGLPPVTMSVNLSGSMFRESALADTISHALIKSCLSAEHLELEITEGVIMYQADSTMRMFSNLKRMGARLAIDDFGTGYSSLSYLRRFPIDTLKIDQSFVQDITRNPDDASLVKAIIAMGHALQLRVIAEGVEDEDQLIFLRQLGCDVMQGYHFSRPLPADDLTAFLRSRTSN